MKKQKVLPNPVRDIIKLIFEKHLGLSPNKEHYEAIKKEWYKRKPNYDPKDFKKDLIEETEPDLFTLLYKLCQKSAGNIPTKKQADFKRISLYLYKVSKNLRGL